MTPTTEEIMANFCLLSKAEKKKVISLIEAEKNQETAKQEGLRLKIEKFQRALQWIEEHK
jgi:hypothetical protein